VFKQTGTKTAPWHIIPANNRWFARATVAAIIVDKLKSLHAKYPAPSEEQKGSSFLIFSAFNYKNM
jgi:hypothetical protein